MREERLKGRNITEKRKRNFIPSWTTMYTWLENGSNGMTCTICTKYEKTGTFITGCKNYKRDTINQHEKSEAHQFNVTKYNGQKNPENSEGARALRTMNQLQVNRIALLFRNVFALSKKGRPYQRSKLEVAQGNQNVTWVI